MKLFKIIVLLLIFCFSCSRDNTTESTVRFAICADVHQDIIHDAPDRLSAFIEKAKSEKVDFIIQLGDFCFPIEKNKSFLKIWNSFPGLKYHTLGNHDMDQSTKEKEMEFLGMKKSYYSFDQNAFHFIVLDPNFFVENDMYIDYGNGNYFAHHETRGTIPPTQIEWLKNDISNTDKLVIVFSHQRLEGKDGGTKNKEKIRRILEEANSSKHKVIACFSGHDHLDYYSKINGIYYIRINSMSYKWAGEKFAYPDRFSKEINDYRPELKYTFPYTNPLFGIVEISTNGSLTIKGEKGSYIPPGPDELGKENNPKRSPSLSDRNLKF